VAFGDDITPLNTGENVIGRDPSAAVIIDSTEVSRQHARIIVRPNEVLLEDLGSKNGTFVDGERISRPTPIAEDATIRLGKRTHLVLRKRGGTSSTMTSV
jgi:pSer/pThr/pTyr-binding forkhead associated (FHA) protein